MTETRLLNLIVLLIIFVLIFPRTWWAKLIPSGGAAKKGGGWLWRIIRWLFKAAFWLIKWLVWKPLKWLFGLLFRWLTTPKGTRARWMSLLERLFFIGRSRRGFVIDTLWGMNLSHKKSAMNMMVLGGSGSGKSSTVVLGFLLSSLWRRIKGRSAIVFDVSGELWEKSSGYLSKYVKVKRIAFDDVIHSLRINFLLMTPPEGKAIYKLAETIVENAFPNSKEPYFNGGGKSILYVVMYCVKGLDEAYQSISLVRHLLGQIGEDGKKLLGFVRAYAPNKLIISEYEALCTSKNLQDFVSTAIQATRLFADEDIAMLCSGTEHLINWESLRTEEQVVFIQIRETEQELLAPLTGLAYTTAYHSIYQPPKRGQTKWNDIYIVGDEWANTYIPGAPKIIATSRKHCAHMLIIQTPDQLSRYGHDEGKVIYKNCATKVFMPGGIDLDLGREIEQMAGKRYVTRKDGRGNKSQTLEPLITAQQARQSKKAIVFHGNKPPLRLRIWKYFRLWWLNRRSKIAPPIIGPFERHEVPLFDLE